MPGRRPTIGLVDPSVTSRSTRDVVLLICRSGPGTTTLPEIRALAELTGFELVEVAVPQQA